MIKLQEEKNPFGLCRVRRGDDLAALCRACGVPELSVIRLNRLSAPPEEGALLVLPEEGLEVRVASAGDTVHSLCRDSGMDENEFLLYNGAELFPGQEILIRERREL